MQGSIFFVFLPVWLQVSLEISNRMAKLFLPDPATGHRPCHGGSERYQSDPHWKDLVLFYEFFHGCSGRGCGARYCEVTICEGILYFFVNFTIAYKSLEFVA